DIAGYIEKPNYYFNHPDQKTQADLDILLQTQGYRRYSYDDIINNKQKPVGYSVEKGIDIIGTLRTATGIPVNRGNVHIAISDKNYFANTITNADGRFIFQNLVFPDSAKVVLSARDNIHASDLVLTVDGEQRQSIPINYDEPDGITNIDSALTPYLKNSKIQFNNLHILKEVVIRDKRIVKTVSHKDYGNLASLSDEPDHVIKADQLEGCNSLLECIKVLAMGMTFENDNFYVLRDYNQGKKTPTQVFVKGMPVDVSYLQSIDPKTVESIEIFTKDELGLVNSAYNTNGAIVVNLRKVETTKISYQDLKQLIGTRNELTLLPKGYEPVKTFYMPRYTGTRTNQPAQIDRRSTIYWNPNIETDKTGTASLEYFNSDGKGTYRVTVEGIDSDGNLGRVVYRYVVK
ncbi:MAG TPA: carboxypeptidase-like regulatory domain-containing protein, partial [Mucilaginibacter sp.]|nr:carboxypeptidase-like regulatory domain-containing protein [Mucilaginibacter sp.]